MIALAGAVLVFMAVIMTLGAITVVNTRNGGWTDVFWTFGTGAAGVAAALPPLQAEPATPRQMLVAALVALWSIRLGLYIFARVSRSAEDPRYARMREDWGAKFTPRLFGLALIQAPATMLLAISIAAAAHRPGELRIMDFAGFAILLVAIAGEALADHQMKRFKADPANRGKVIDTGLWNWSRHPNYVFEWLGWLAYPVIAIDLSGSWSTGWLSLIAPVVMYLILTRVTGVPPLEQAMLRSRGDAYRAYQARVPAFLPNPFSRRTTRP